MQWPSSYLEGNIPCAMHFHKGIDKDCWRVRAVVLPVLNQCSARQSAAHVGMSCCWHTSHRRRCSLAMLLFAYLMIEDCSLTLRLRNMVNTCEWLECMVLTRA